MAPGSTQPLVKMSTRSISWGVKVAGAWGWPHHLHVPNVMEIWEPKPPGTLWATQSLLRDIFTFYLYPTKLIISYGYSMFNLAFSIYLNFLGTQLECKRKVRCIKKGTVYNAMEA